MEYIISGGLGFIGQNLVNSFPEATPLSILDIKSKCDLRRVEIAIPTCDTFIHLASHTNVRNSLTHPQETFLDNCKMTLNALNYAKSHNSRFIFTSSMGAPELLSPYSASKFACESLCVMYKQTYNVNTMILRLANVYGPYSIHKESVIPKFIKRCIDHEPLEIYGNGLQTRDFIHVDDIVKAITMGKSKTTHNMDIGTGIATSIIKLTEIIRQLSIKYLFYEPGISHSSAITGEIKKVKLKTDIKSTIPIYEGLETTFKWFVKNYK